MPKQTAGRKTSATPQARRVNATIEDVKAITPEDRDAFIKEIYTHLSDENPSSDQYLQWLVDRINREPKWKAWSALIIYKMSVIK